MITHLRITVVVENRSEHLALRSEHGLALWIEADAQRFLLDTGAGTALLPNAEALGIDLRQTQALILSHGHSDHSGGLASLLALQPDLSVHDHPQTVDQRYSLRGGQPRAIGMPVTARTALATAQRHSSRAPQWLAPGICCTGEIPRAAGLPANDLGLFCDAAATRPDPLADDQALVIATHAGLVVISGCCHAGITPTLTTAARLHPGRPFLALIGGLHLAACDDATRRHHIASLRRARMPQVIAGHCTGSAAEALLAQHWAAGFSPLRCGDRWQLGHDRLEAIAPA